MRNICLATAFALCVPGCGSLKNEPLVFTSTKDLGISIGAAATDGGGGFLVGYKGQDLAIVPVSVVDASGEQFVGAHAPGGYADSFSVLGQFDAKAGQAGKGASAGLGRFFATGPAAQALAQGFKTKMGGNNRTTVAECKDHPQPGTDAEKSKAAEDRLGKIANLAEARVNNAATLAEQRLGKARAPSVVAPTDKKTDDAHGARMIFGQYDFLAVAVDTSTLDTGLKLTLGYRGRNVALIPVVARDAQGQIVPIRGIDLARDGSGQITDVLSVLGQFDSKTTGTVGTDGATLNTGLGSFFSTGGAAQILSSGFGTKLCEEYETARGGN